MTINQPNQSPSDNQMLGTTQHPSSQNLHSNTMTPSHQAPTVETASASQMYYPDQHPYLFPDPRLIALSDSVINTSIQIDTPSIPTTTSSIPPQFFMPSPPGPVHMSSTPMIPQKSTPTPSIISSHTSHPMSSNSSISNYSHMNLQRHQLNAEADLRNQIKSLLIDKRHMEHNMRKLLDQMQTAQRETHTYMQKTHDLMERLTQAQNENRDLLRQLMQANHPHLAHTRASDTLYSANSIPHMQRPHKDLIDLNPPVPYHQTPHQMPAPNHNTDPPSTVTFSDQASFLMPRDFSSDQQVGPAPIPSNNQHLSLQDKLIQQLLENSNAQQTFYQSKLDEGSHDVKFPKFSGKPDEKFNNWYNQILSVLATPKWCTLYDPVSEDIINESEAPINLFTSLYSKLMLSLTGEAQNILMSKPHLRGKGLDSLKALQATYDLVMSDPQSLIKSAEFARPMRKPSETVTTYAARFIQLRKDLQGFETVSDDRFRLRFIMGLGPMFTTIQSNLKNLPNWQTTNIELLIREANEHIQTTEAIREQNKLHRSLKEGGSSNKDKPERDKMIQEKNQKRMKEIDAELEQGIFSPAKYVKMVRKDYCVYHNANHATNKCAHIRSMVSKYPKNTFVCSPAHTSGPQPSALLVTPPAFNIAPPPATITNPPAFTANQVNMDSIQEIDLRELQLQDAERQLAALDKQLNTNDQVNPYSVHSKHVITKSDTDSTTFNNEIKFIIDSGANTDRF